MSEYEVMDIIIELIEVMKWTDWALLLMVYISLAIFLCSTWGKNKRKIWYNYIWLVICSPVGLHLIWQNRKFKKSRKKKLTALTFSIWGLLITSVAVSLGTIPHPNHHDLSAFNESTFEKREAGHPLVVHFIDVGQGDATLIEYADFHILIDAGNNGQEHHVLNYLKKQRVDDIEILIATHPDSDHIGGLEEVLDVYDANLIIDPGVVHTSQTYERYDAAVKEHVASGALYLNKQPMVIEIADNVTFEVLQTGDDYYDRNNQSVVTKLSYGEIDVLLTGDAEEEAEADLLSEDIEAEIYKVGHHGSSSSSTEAFLKQVEAEVGIISAGKDNKYGHPHREVLQRLDKYGIKTYQTAEDGDVVITITESGYDIRTSK